MSEQDWGWFDVCQPLDRPDGPARLFGPFLTLEEAAFDCFVAKYAESILCNNKHFAGRASLPLEVAYLHHGLPSTNTRLFTRERMLWNHEEFLRAQRRRPQVFESFCEAYYGTNFVW